jgi:hypothetical protein
MESPPDLATLAAALATAPDARLGRVVALLDGLERREIADELLQAARPRLCTLRPARPLRFTRLLGIPLEPVLVDLAAWDSDPARIPRAALPPLAEVVRRALGDTAEEIEMAALGHSTGDRAIVARLGARLWPRAAALPWPKLPPGWEAASLPPEAAPPIIELARALWRDGVASWQARGAAQSAEGG